MKNSKPKQKTCSRGHAYTGSGPCPKCWSGRYKKKSGAEHKVTGKATIFPQQGGWMFVSVPKKYSKMYADVASKERGLVAITARVGETSWDTSLLPMGDGSHFIALPAKVRKTEGIILGEAVTIYFKRRKR